MERNIVKHLEVGIFLCLQKQKLGLCVLTYVIALFMFFVFLFAYFFVCLFFRCRRQLIQMLVFI